MRTAPQVARVGGPACVMDLGQEWWPGARAITMVPEFLGFSLANNDAIQQLGGSTLTLASPRPGTSLYWPVLGRERVYSGQSSARNEFILTSPRPGTCLHWPVLSWWGTKSLQPTLSCVCKHICICVRLCVSVFVCAYVSACGCVCADLCLYIKKILSLDSCDLFKVGSRWMIEIGFQMCNKISELHPHLEIMGWDSSWNVGGCIKRGLY